MRKPRYSKNFERDWEFYNRNRHALDFAAVDIRQKYNQFQYSETGHTAKECFWALDSQGIHLPCKEIDLLYEILTCKASVNFHIKMWAEDRARGWLGKWEMENQIAPEFDLPQWVLDATESQKIKFYGTLRYLGSA